MHNGRMDGRFARRAAGKTKPYTFGKQTLQLPMKRSTRLLVTAAALAGLYSGSLASRAFADDTAGTPAAKDDQKDKSSCKGKESCKAKDSCKGKEGCHAKDAKDSCKGKESCKAKDSCKAKESCKGKDGCSSKGA
jgi:hypothetical protein